MSGLSILSRALRAVGTVTVFSIVGPLAIAFASAAAVAAIGKPFFDLFSALTGIGISHNWLTISLALLLGFTAVASIFPSFCVGVAFAISAFCFGWATLPAAWVAAIIAVIGFVLLGAIITASENSPLILIPVGEFRQAAYLVLFLIAPAVVACSLAWLASRPLHRVMTPA